jgi:tetratricopeptide (TPR) repeat protein
VKRGKEVAKLRILRGDTTHAEFALTGQTVRLGRSPENEIVLEDPGKGVSRTHAVISFEDGRYILVDNQSQNGIWVAGSRVPSAVLAPGVVASVGPFRLTIETSSDQDTATAIHPRTEDIPPPGSASRASLGDAPRFAEPPALPAGATDVPKTRRWYEEPRTWAMTGAAALFLAASGFGLYVFVLKPPPSFDLVAAEAMVNAGRCQDAMAELIEPALRANPNNPVAVRLKGLCDVPKPDENPLITSTVPPAPTATQLLDEADGSLTANACQAGLDKITQALTLEPTNERALKLAERAKSCLNQGQPLPPTAVLAVARPPSAGGLDVLPKELDKDYRARMFAMRARYDAAVAALRKGEHLQAAREFEQIARDVPAGYLDLAQHREAADQGIRGEAQTRLAAAQAAEGRGDFDAAADGYRRAHELDSGIQIDGHMQRLTETRSKLGDKRCGAGKLEFSYGNRAAAIAAFQDVLKLLPSSAPCYTLAQERLRQLGQ